MSGKCRSAFFGAISVIGLFFGSVPGLAQTAIIVRHAEKAVVPADDPGLTAAGQQRAVALAAALRDAHLTAIVTSTLRRTRDTAAPSAAMAHVSAVAIPIGQDVDAHVAAMVARIVALPSDAVVLVVGHSNTVPLIAHALGSTAPIAIPDCAFDRMVILRLGAKPAPTIVARYGTESATCPNSIDR